MCTNLVTVQVHKNTLLVSPSEQFSDAVRRLAEHLEDRTCRSAQYFELGDCEGVSPYQEALNQLDHAIGQLKRARAEMQKLSKHAHQWDSNDYCSICGADGRA